MDPITLIGGPLDGERVVRFDRPGEVLFCLLVDPIVLMTRPDGTDPGKDRTAVYVPVPGRPDEYEFAGWRR